MNPFFSWSHCPQIIASNGGQVPISQQALALSHQQNGEDPFPVTNDPKNEPGRRV